MLADFVRETTATTGTGTLTLSAVTGFGRFSDAFATGERVYYALKSGNGDRETGIGTVGAGNTLARTLVLTTLVGATYTTSSPTAISLTGTSDVIASPVKSSFEGKSAFRAYRNTSQSLAAGAFTKIVFDNVHFDTLGEYSTSTGLFTAQTAGVYAFAGFMHNSMNDGDRAIEVWVNGSAYARLAEIATSAGTSGQMGSNPGPVKLSAGDTVGVYAYSSSTNSVTAVANDKSLTYFSGIKLS